MQAIEILLSGPYNLLYLGGFTLALGIAAVAGRQRNWPLLPSLGLLVACVAGGIIGSRLFHFDLHVATQGEKTILGGMLGGTVAFLVTQHLLRFDAGAARVFAPAALLGFAVGRIGCLLVGCCFGKPTDLPWGRTYGAGTAPYETLLTAGLIPPGAMESLPLHPTQLYEAGFALALALVLWRSGGWLRSRGGAALAMGVGYGSARFLIEFVRWRGDDVGNAVGPLQWMVLAWVVVTGVALVLCEYRARRMAAEPSAGVVSEPAPLPVAVVALAIIGLALATGWLTPLERLTLGSATLPLLAVAVWRLRPVQRRVGGPAIVMSGLFVTLSQPADTIPSYPYTYHTFGAGGMSGSYVESCGGRHRYQVGGASLGYTRVSSPTDRISVQGDVFHGRDLETDITPEDELRQTGVSVRGRVDTRWIGVGLGGVAGNLVLDGARTEVLPSAMLRLGRADEFFGEARIFWHSPAPVPAPAIQLGAGVAIGDLGSHLRFGVSDAGFYGGGEFVTGGGMEIVPFGAIADGETYQLGLNLRFRTR